MVVITGETETEVVGAENVPTPWIVTEVALRAIQLKVELCPKVIVEGVDENCTLLWPTGCNGWAISLLDEGNLAEPASFR